MFSNKSSLDVSSMLESRDPTEAEILTNGGRLDVLTQEKECNAWKNNNDNRNGRLCSDVFLTLGGWSVFFVFVRKNVNLETRPGKASAVLGFYRSRLMDPSF